jgi:hypothetical protein
MVVHVVQRLQVTRRIEVQLPTVAPQTSLVPCQPDYPPPADLLSPAVAPQTSLIPCQPDHPPPAYLLTWHRLRLRRPWRRIAPKTKAATPSGTNSAGEGNSTETSSGVKRLQPTAKSMPHSVYREGNSTVATNYEVGTNPTGEGKGDSTETGSQAKIRKPTKAGPPPESKESNSKVEGDSAVATNYEVGTTSGVEGVEGNSAAATNYDVVANSAGEGNSTETRSGVKRLQPTAKPMPPSVYLEGNSTVATNYEVGTNPTSQGKGDSTETESQAKIRKPTSNATPPWRPTTKEGPPPESRESRATPPWRPTTTSWQIPQAKEAPPKPDRKTQTTVNTMARKFQRL